MWALALSGQLLCRISHRGDKAYPRNSIIVNHQTDLCWFETPVGESTCSWDWNWSLTAMLNCFHSRWVGVEGPRIRAKTFQAGRLSPLGSIDVSKLLLCFITTGPQRTFQIKLREHGHRCGLSFPQNERSPFTPHPLTPPLPTSLSLSLHSAEPASDPANGTEGRDGRGQGTGDPDGG